MRWSRWQQWRRAVFPLGCSPGMWTGARSWQRWGRPDQNSCSSSSSSASWDESTARKLVKPQDSFGKKDKTFSWSAESAAHHQKTLINLPALVLNDVFSSNNVKWLNIAIVHYLWKSVQGDSEHFDIWVISWKWKQLGVNNEQGIYSSYRSIKSCIDTKKKKKKKKKSLLIFRHIPKLFCGFNIHCNMINASSHSKVLVDLNEFSFINLLKGAAFSLQTSENNLKHP